MHCDCRLRKLPLYQVKFRSLNYLVGPASIGHIAQQHTGIVSIRQRIFLVPDSISTTCSSTSSVLLGILERQFKLFLLQHQGTCTATTDNTGYGGILLFMCDPAYYCKVRNM